MKRFQNILVAVDSRQDKHPVMGTIARTGLTGALLGNTAEKVVDRIECSVLAVKPDGFVSPVSLPDT